MADLAELPPYPGRGLDSRFHRVFIKSALPLLPDRGLVLDVGCGNGLVTEALAGPGRRVLGVDISPKLISEARARPRLGGLDFQVMDARDLQLESSCAEAVLSVSAMHLWDPGPVLAEFRRILKPGGHILLLDMDKTFYTVGSRLRQWRAGLKAWGLVRGLSAGLGYIPVWLDPEARRHRGLIRQNLKETGRWTRADLARTYEDLLPGCSVEDLFPWFLVRWAKAR